MPDFLFTRRFYLYFGVSGLLLDFMNHAVQAGQGLNSLWLATQLVLGINTTLLPDNPLLFSVGVAAHQMFLIAYLLLYLRGR